MGEYLVDFKGLKKSLRGVKIRRKVCIWGKKPRMEAEGQNSSPIGMLLMVNPVNVMVKF